MKLKTYRILFFVLFFISTLSLSAQNILIGVGGGWATFGMKSTKQLNQEVVDLLPFKPLATDNFPAYFFYKAEVMYCFPKYIALGINLSTTSTGARYTLADYSGKYTMDNVQKGFFPGLKVLVGKAPGKDDGLNLSLEGGVSFSSMNIDTEFKLYDESDSDNQDFDAFGFYFQPGISYFKKIIPQLKVNVTLGYFLGFENGYYLHGQKDQKIFLQDTNKRVKPQWDGIRAGINLYWDFPYHSEWLKKLHREKQQ